MSDPAAPIRLFGLMSTSAQQRQVIVGAIERCRSDGRLGSGASIRVAVTGGGEA